MTALRKRCLFDRAKEESQNRMVSELQKISEQSLGRNRVVQGST